MTDTTPVNDAPLERPTRVPPPGKPRRHGFLRFLSALGWLIVLALIGGLIYLGSMVMLRHNQREQWVRTHNPEPFITLINTCVTRNDIVIWDKNPIPPSPQAMEKACVTEVLAQAAKTHSDQDIAHHLQALGYWVPAPSASVTTPVAPAWQVAVPKQLHVRAQSARSFEE